MIYSLTFHTRILEQIVYAQASSRDEAKAKAVHKVEKVFILIKCTALADNLDELDPEERALFDTDGVAVFAPEALR